MQVIKTILLATDFSEQGRVVEDRARELAERCGATLCVVHGIEPIMGVDSDDASDFEDFYQRLIDRAERELEQRTFAGDEGRMSVKQHVRIGPRWQVVLEVAEAENADLIVLGRRNFLQGSRAPLGTTSQKVFFGSTRPVMFVPTD